MSDEEMGESQTGNALATSAEIEETHTEQARRTGRKRFVAMTKQKPKGSVKAYRKSNQKPAPERPLGEQKISTVEQYEMLQRLVTRRQELDRRKQEQKQVVQESKQQQSDRLKKMRLNYEVHSRYRLPCSCGAQPSDPCLYLPILQTASKDNC